MPHKARIGSISSGTMRPEDLIPVFASELESLTPKSAKNHRALVKEAEAIEDYDTDEASEVLDALFDALNEHAPEYCCFGSNEGDGADYGFWPSVDSLEEDVRASFVLKVNDTSEVPSSYRGLVMHVNDHGNMTLYRKRSRKALVEIWSLV